MSIKAKATTTMPRSQHSFVSGWRFFLLAIFISLSYLWVHFANQLSIAPGEYVTDYSALIREDALPDAAPPVNNGNAASNNKVQQRKLTGKDANNNAGEEDANESTSAAASTNDKDPRSSRKGEERKSSSSSSALNQKYLRHLRSLKPFPKHLHILFPDKEYYKRKDPPLPFVKNSILRFMNLNPTWNVTVHDDNDMDDIIRKAAGDGIISRKEMEILLGDETQPSAHPVERADLARMLIMWYYGGMYVDADSLDNPKNFDKVFQPSIKMCLPIYLNINFAQSLVCSSPGNRLYMEMIKRMSKHRMTSNNGEPLERRGGWAKSTALFSMGPPMYNNVVYHMVFRRAKAGAGDIEGIEDDMKALQKEAGDLIATGQFIDECNSFIADPFEGCKLWNRRALYKMYNMSSWGKAVKSRWGEEA